MSSWIGINAIWVELPLLVRLAPESWALASYIVIVIQIANIGPFIYTISKSAFPEKVKEWPVIIATIIVGMLASVLLIFFWNVTTVWVGINELRSTGLLVLSLFLSLVDCTSSVLYFPYMSTFDSQYMTATFVGEGMSGLIPAIIGLAQITVEQNVSENPVVNNYVPKSSNINQIELFFLLNDSSQNGTTPPKKENDYVKERFSVSIYFLLIAILLSISLIMNLHDYENLKQTDKFGIGFLLMTAWINSLTNGVLPSLQTYSAQPYGSLAYNLHVKLSVLVNPLACFAALFIHVNKFWIVVVLTLFGSVLAAFQIALACLSPNPPLKKTSIGIACLVATQVVLIAILSYTKVTIATIVSRMQGRQWLLFFGVATQVGSFVGASVTFCLVNYTDIFQSEY
ncbi:hypothetical protein HELRODRAFT_187704 [Helobdella robusta]|uniref:Riboflavin transporter n=1 Tax=Helobdella robusta TaxID=6412 RepID=T1FPC1_HELRO|nr:hypothetical protein HELRODRAFT_187704 [Helobdella robusta]ESO10531.1 hypothetical protein HELRODRAFT_187704 [Helobdella robusta]